MIRSAFGIVLLSTLVAFLISPAADDLVLFLTRKLVVRVARNNFAAQNDPVWKDGALRVVTCGTGTPLPDKTRASQCLLVLAGEEFLIFVSQYTLTNLCDDTELKDTGDGSAENLASFDVPANFSAIFLTHFHSDHIADLGEVILQRWTRGAASTPVEVYGPPGVERVVRGFEEAYALDSSYRVAHHSEAVLVAAGGRATPKVVNVCGTEFEDRGDAPKKCTIEQRGVVALERNGVKVTAFLVHHEPARPAYGYRVDFNGRSVTISGDTVPCEEVVHYARNSDILIHDAINTVVVQEMAKGFAEMGGYTGTRFGKVFADIVDYHSNPDEAIDTAADANVSLLVLTHMVPPRRNAILRRVARASWGSRRERNAVWKGSWVEADDGMMWELPPAPSRAIIQTWRPGS